jgi:N-acetylmuramoyl-L-alanine amidase
MIKRIFILLVAASTIPFVFSFTPIQNKKKTIQTIIVDPGHGGKDQGAKGIFSTEAKICLEIGMKLGKAIEQNLPGIKVIYTRTEDILAGNRPDQNSANRYRAEFANQSGGDLFVAIHVNSAPKLKNKVANGYKYVGKGKKRRKVQAYKYYYTPNPAHGTETYIWAADRSDLKSEVIKPEDEFGENDSTLVIPEINDPVMKAFQLLYAKKYFESSLHLANFIENEFVTEGRLSRGVKQRNQKGIWVLQATGMPSVLVETGFISDKKEEEYLNSDEGQDAIVKNIINALRNYIASFDKQPGTNKNAGNNIPAQKISENDAMNINKKEQLKQNFR